jgi:ligand-binding sensor domain-containing protein
VTALDRQPGGRLWIATPGGLAYLRGARFTTLATTQDLAAARLSTLTPHSAGQLWIGTEAGAVKLTVDGLVTYGSEDGLDHPRVRRLFESPDGSVVAVSGDWVVNRFDGRRFHAMRPRVPAGAISTFHSHGAFLDRTNRWWLLTGRGLYRLRPSADIEVAARQPPEAVYTARSGLPNDSVERMFEDSRGDIWIANRSAASAFNLSRWQRATGHIRVFEDGFTAEHQFPMAFAEDREGAGLDWFRIRRTRQISRGPLSSLRRRRWRAARRRLAACWR